uniref:Uncharacterized protein n=1 Tax=Tardiphaga robiniae TaxID=943830 RepID=A0A109ZY22_9BRAD|nr:hypothetical protein PROKKA_00588 [Tardiphaga robiniae]
MGVSVEPNTPGFRVHTDPLRGSMCPGMTRVSEHIEIPRNDSVGRSASDFVRHFTALKNTDDANTAKGAKTAGFVSIRLRDETNLCTHETIFYTDAIGWKPAGTTPPSNK